MISLFKEGYILIILYEFFCIFYEKVENLFWLQVTHCRDTIITIMIQYDTVYMMQYHRNMNHMIYQQSHPSSKFE